MQHNTGHGIYILHLKGGDISPMFVRTHTQECAIKVSYIRCHLYVQETSISFIPQVGSAVLQDNRLASLQPYYLISEFFHHVYQGSLIFMWSCPSSAPSSGPDDQ